MGLSIVVGKKGSGKTAFALQLIAEELERGRRPVITNMQIYKEKLEQWFRDQGKEVCVADRLLCLDIRDKRFRRWWRINPDDSMKGRFGDETWKDCEGCLYVVDEGQHYYNSRGWAQRMGKDEEGEAPGPECEDFLCQERKTSRDTIVTTPSSSLLDKNFRTLSTECVVLDNWYKKKIRGISPPGRFQAQVYENCPPLPGEEPIASPKFYLDVAGLMSCYNTAAGAGFIGSRADMDQPAKRGVPLWLAIACLPVLGFFAWFALHSGLSATTKHFTKKMERDMPHYAVSKVEAKTNLSPVVLQHTNEVVGAVLTNRLDVRPPVSAHHVKAVVHGLHDVVVWDDGRQSVVRSVKLLDSGDWEVDGRLYEPDLPHHLPTPDVEKPLIGQTVRSVRAPIDESWQMKPEDLLKRLPARAR